MVDCQSCTLQKDCSFRKKVTELIKMPSPFGGIDNHNKILGKEFYSQVATLCSIFEPIEDLIFGVSKGNHK